MTTKILIVNQHYKMGGIKKTLDVLISELSKEKDIEIDIQFLEQPIGSTQFPANVTVLPELYLVSTYKMPMWDIKKLKKHLLRIVLKFIDKLLTLLLGQECVTDLLVQLTPMNRKV